MTPRKWDIYLARSVLFLSALVLIVFIGAGHSAKRDGASVSAQAGHQTLSEVYTDRTAQRDEELKRLGELIDDESAPEDIRRLAGEREITLRTQAAQEAALEALLSARGCPPLLVTVQPLSVSVLVEETLSRDEAAVILDMVMRECGVTGENVKIIQVN